MPLPVQRLLATIALVVLAPVIGVLALMVRASSPGPAFHRATRITRGRPFTLYKLRSMRVGAAAAGPGVTADTDDRITPLGRRLRKWKLDELPQLWNVVRGEMAIVGPRPEDPRYVDLANPQHRTVFLATPGITGPAAIAFRDEEWILADAAALVAQAAGRQEPTAEDIERAYREGLLPRKLAIDEEYLRTRSFSGDLVILARTVTSVLRKPAD